MYTDNMREVLISNSIQKYNKNVKWEKKEKEHTMAKSVNQKSKLLYITDFLKKNTDETHSVTTAQIIEYLAANDIKADRKTIYTDIEALENFGMDIVRVPGPKGGYILGEREFQLAEVKLLVDLVQSSKFITTKKSRELVKKLQGQVSKYDAKALQRQVVVADRNKTANESIYYSVDHIHEAIAKNVMITFQYFEWDVDKKPKLRKNGALYKVSPWLLNWDDENYYLVAYDTAAGIMKHYRVDKMLDITLTDETRRGRAEYDKIDIASYTQKTFGMFAGEERTVSLLCDNSLTGVMVDRFGQEVAMRRFDDEHILARADVEVSPQFFGWITGLSGKAKIYAPEDVKERYQAYLEQILHGYKYQ